MPKFNILLLLFAFLCTTAIAQTPPADSLWIEAGNLRICLRADGSLHSGTPGGAVLYRHTTPKGEEKWVKIVQDAGLWFGGLDPGGSLTLSVQKFEPRATDFRAGFAGVPGSGKIWSVSYEQIEQHVADYSDNARIDDPIEAIFAWPGKGNRFFETYNGFALPENFALHYNFSDNNLNGKYEPDQGDFPEIRPRGAGNFPLFPEQMHFFAFHIDTAGMFQHLGVKPLPYQGVGQLLTYRCVEEPVLENTFFMAFEWQHTGNERIDSAQVGLYMNADIGNPNNDYHGSRWDSYFTYNAAAVDSDGFEAHPPMLMTSAVSSPIDHNGDIQEARLIPIWASNSLQVSQAMWFPQLPAEYFNYLTASWRDGRPLQKTGNGYGVSVAPVTARAFEGNPYLLGGWTEVSAQNTPGDRQGVLSWNTRVFPPQRTNHLMIMITLHPRDTTLSPRYWYDKIVSEKNFIRDGFTHGHEFMELAPTCRKWPHFSFPGLFIRPFPNPTSNLLNVLIDGGGRPEYIRLYDALGRVVAEQSFSCNPFCDWERLVQLSVAHLPAGLYAVEVVTATGERAVRKVIVL